VHGRGDFNQDGFLDVNDLDVLGRAILADTADDSWDLNLDGRVDRDDQTIWLSKIKRTTYGDANLDGTFDSTDFVLIFQAGEYEDAVALNSTWATGDWNGDREFTSGDLVMAFQLGVYADSAASRANVHAVPELRNGLWLLCIPGVIRRTRRSTRCLR
ncbi:MAG: hypothetical protein KDB23_20735, partial [Planctomycetales bacterium]|nr:hypothetical protein [Planctomycetales bacterium]